MHSWSAHVAYMTRGTGFPQCSGKAVCNHNSLATKAFLVAAEWDNGANVVYQTMSQQSDQTGYWFCGCKWIAKPCAQVS